uniref:Uncharacterized protein n=1 Tax=Lactuca sativa TaxID=4236 RepID=A0A9R1XER6_LACSA|nr:hypothetical protein LSAT_V11C400216360 [Lactuca sativa]
MASYSSTSSASSKCNVELQASHPCKCDMPSHDDYAVEKNIDLGQIYNLTLKLGNLENEISICRNKLEEEKNSNLVFKQELDKIN